MTWPRVDARDVIVGDVSEGHKRVTGIAVDTELSPLYIFTFHDGSTDTMYGNDFFRLAYDYAKNANRGWDQ